MFSINARDVDRAEVKGILKIAKETMSDRYLGLPVHVGKSHTAIFSYLKDRVTKNSGLEGENALKSKQRDSDQGGSTSHPHLCNGASTSLKLLVTRSVP